MGFIVIESENNDLSWVLGKNPDSGMIARNMRAGIVWGWYHNPQTYVTRFNDYTDEVSFRKNIHDNYNYLGSLQYCSPLLLSTIIQELFSSTLNKDNPKDTECVCKISLNLIRLNKRAINFIEKLNNYIKLFNIGVIETKYIGLYNFTISSEKSTIKELFNYSYLLGNLLNVLTIGYVDRPKLEQLDKMINFMIKINVPYYPRYLIKTNMISREDFVVLKNKLEQIGNSVVKMNWGNSQEQRYKFIESNVIFTSDIIDFGCGEGFYVRKLIPQLSTSNKYIAWDADPEELAKVKYFKEKNPQYTNLIIPESEKELFELVKTFNTKPIILMSEVFEHVEPNEAIRLVEKIKSNINFSHMIITTPDVGFNIHYSSDGEINMRHHDHKYEYSKDEFENIINNIFDSNYKKNFYQVGDVIDSNSISQSYIIYSN
jgi:2-polyprenyl-3-methyl-5-hydroxy-6-metoxy-1,4-benzoquinol methylase